MKRKKPQEVRIFQKMQLKSCLHQKKGCLRTIDFRRSIDVCEAVRRFEPPEPYKRKGARFQGQLDPFGTRTVRNGYRGTMFGILMFKSNGKRILIECAMTPKSVSDECCAQVCIRTNRPVGSMRRLLNGLLTNMVLSASAFG